MEGFVIFLLIVGAVIGLIAWGVHSAKAVRQRWQQFAVQHGLEYSGGVSASSNPHISGWYGRTHVTVCTVTRGSGKNRHTYTQFHGHVNVPMPQGLNLTREGFFNRVGKFFGGQDVQLGDKQLDDAFLIKAHDAMGAFNLMRIPPVKQALLMFLARHPNMQLNERHMIFEESGVCSDMARMKTAIDDLAYLGQTLEAGHNDLARASRQPVQKAPTRTISKSGLRPMRTADGPQTSAQIVATAKVAYDTMNADLQPSVDIQNREAAAQTAALRARQAARTAEHDRKMVELRTERERRVAEAQADRDAAFSVAQTGIRPVAENAGGRTAAEQHEVSRLADAFHKLEQKMEDAGAFRAVDVAPMGSTTGGFGSEKASEFAVGGPVPVPVVPRPTPEVTPATKFEMPTFETPKFETPKYEPPKPAFDGGGFGGPVAPPQKPVKGIAGFDDLVAAMSDSGLFSRDRERILAAVKDRAFILKVEVERIERTFGFDLPEKFRDGRTIEGRVQGKDIRVAARYPATENAGMDRIAPGVVIEVQGCVAAWDDLFKKATLDSF